MRVISAYLRTLQVCSTARRADGSILYNRRLLTIPDYCEQGLKRGVYPMRVIAIDGPAGSGKTTIAKALAARLGLEYLNTGAMYRAVAFAVLRAGGDPADETFVTAMARNADIRVEGDEVTVDGVDATKAVRSPDVTQSVSAVAAITAVREELVAAQRAWACKRGGGVLEGRDIGTVVFPDAVFKAYLTVDPAEGAQRRALQEGLSYSGGFSGDSSCSDSAGMADVYPGMADVSPHTLRAVAADLARRNHADSTRVADPLRVDADAVVVDTTGKTCGETIDMLFEHMGSAGIDIGACMTAACTDTTDGLRGQTSER